MANPLFNELSQKLPMNDGGFSRMLSQLENFKRNYQGNPKEEVQQLLNSGRMSQAQFNQLSQMANQIIKLTK